MLMILYGLQFADKTSLSRGVIFVCLAPRAPVLLLTFRV